MSNALVAFTDQVANSFTTARQRIGGNAETGLIAGRTDEKYDRDACCFQLVNEIGVIGFGRDGDEQPIDPVADHGIDQGTFAVRLFVGLGEHNGIMVHCRRVFNPVQGQGKELIEEVGDDDPDLEIAALLEVNSGQIGYVPTRFGQLLHPAGRVCTNAGVIAQGFRYCRYRQAQFFREVFEGNASSHGGVVEGKVLSGSPT